MSHEIVICMGSACFARGNSKNVEQIEKFLSDNGLDSQVTLIGCHCTDGCARGPLVWVDGKQFCNVEKDKIKDIFRAISK